MSRPHPSQQQLDFTLSQLTRLIPTPPPRRAKPAKSRWGLKVGDILTQFKPLLNTTITAEVTHVDSLTVTTRDNTGLVEQHRSKDALANWVKQAKRRGKKVAAGNTTELPFPEFDIERSEV